MILSLLLKKALPFALTFVVGCYLNGPAGVLNPECRDPTLTEAQAIRHCSRLRPTSTWERISKGAPW